jgi:hypothetical protein
MVLLTTPSHSQFLTYQISRKSFIVNEITIYRLKLLTAIPVETSLVYLPKPCRQVLVSKAHQFNDLILFIQSTGGSITLASKDPLTPPLIDPNFIGDAFDVVSSVGYIIVEDICLHALEHYGCRTKGCY